MARWQHFFNVFLIVLIIRSGLQVRTEKRPTVFWTPRNNAKGKISLALWFHQSLDMLWLVNGLLFVVLLFVTGHWMRIVPTSWEVFPNALSAALQYVSLDWPTENGWVNYNASSSSRTSRRSSSPPRSRSSPACGCRASRPRTPRR